MSLDKWGIFTMEEIGLDMEIRDTVSMVTTESANDDVPLLATQSLVNETDFQRMKYCQSLSIPIQ